MPVLNPSVIILDFCKEDSIHIVKGILTENLPLEDVNGYKFFKWNLDNKYYSAEIHIYTSKNYDTISKDILETGEAIIIHLNPENESAFEDLDEVSKPFHEFDVKLLICDGFISEDLFPLKQKAVSWCMKYHWELVELNVESSDHSDVEDDFEDSFGFTRIKQALNAHTWSNLKLKNNESNKLGNLVKEMTLNEGTSKLNEIEKLSSDDEVQYTDLNHQESEEEFDNLFSNLNDMKERANAMPHEQRKDYAEKVAIAFLKSLGDNENENA